MIFIDDSLTVVLAGDWNKLYIQPDWLAGNVFEKDEIEIGISGNGSDFSVSYRGEGVTISPGQKNMIFSVVNAEDEVLNNLCRFLNNFIERAYTPQLYAYGFNAKFIENDGTLFAEVLDSMSDTNAIIENGYEITSTQISRVLKCGDKLINMDSSLENRQLSVAFNEHHASEEDKPCFSIDGIRGFIEECSKILLGLGYEIEGDE